ncbi:MAG: 4Fe-4S binding protein [Lautropia sp.]|nr:4Fe-4S binding protein [Lautropia sp.]
MKWSQIGKAMLAVALSTLLSLTTTTTTAAPRGAGAGGTQAYEAALPANLATAADLCALLPCQDVFPGATHFSERKGQPPYVEALGGPDGRQLLGYVMLSTDITDIPAYSGKPVVTLIGMDTAGRFVGIKILKHSEPILLLGIPESALLDFNAQYLGRSVKDTIEVGQSRPAEDIIGVDAISGATVTVIAQNQVIMTSGAAIAKQVGIIEPVVRQPVKYVEPAPGAAPPTWDELVRQGAVQRVLITPQQVGLPKSPDPFIELWFGSLNSPIVGPAILGQSSWKHLMSQLKEGENAIFVIRTAGRESFKGSGFVRGGIYDRIQVRQDGDTFTFRDTDAKNLYGIAAKGAPRATESGIFMIRSTAFSAAYPWKLIFLGNKVDRDTGAKTFLAFDTEYWLPAEYLAGGHPAIVRPDPAWLKVWKARPIQIVLFALLLIAVAVVYALRERLTRLSSHKNKWPVNAFKYTFWLLFIVWVGFGLLAQPSITQVLTWFHAILFKWEWTLFLSDPFIFLYWIFIVITVFLFGRGLFCGWTCPFGSIQEGLHKIGAKVGLKRYQFLLPIRWHDRLKWLKYAVFFGLLTVSLFSMIEAEKLAEVEPFKTTFLVGIFNRSWPFATFVLVIFALSVFIERPYCKYLCPLGASLAMPSTFRWFGLKRKPDCNRCKACAKGCGAQAINADGQIDHRECLHCLDCLILYTDQTACPPLAKERKRRERNGEALTPIGKDGYFIPIRLETLTPANMPVDGVDPRLPTAPAIPPVSTMTGLRRLVAEVLDHLWPFSREAWHRNHLLMAMAVACAIGASLVWVLGAQGSVSPLGLIGAWFGWSVLEVLVRWQGKRYVKDGPWWGKTYREANLMDMLAYVSFKNLLIGAALFWALAQSGTMLP